MSTLAAAAAFLAVFMSATYFGGQLALHFGFNTQSDGMAEYVLVGLVGGVSFGLGLAAAYITGNVYEGEKPLMVLSRLRKLFGRTDNNKNGFPKELARMYLDFADKCFAEICAGVGTSHAADVYKLHPDIKDTHWEEIREDFAALVGDGDDPDLTKRLRGKWVKEMHDLANAHFYTNLQETDREVLAKYSGSDRASMDETFYWMMAYHYTYASLLDAVIVHGMDFSLGQKETMESLRENYISSCREFSELALKLAWNKHNGIAISEEDKQKGKTIHVLMEAERRALAGEKIFDEN